MRKGHGGSIIEQDAIARNSVAALPKTAREDQRAIGSRIRFRGYPTCLDQLRASPFSRSAIVYELDGTQHTAHVLFVNASSPPPPIKGGE